MNGERYNSPYIYYRCCNHIGFSINPRRSLPTSFTLHPSSFTLHPCLPQTSTRKQAASLLLGGGGFYWICSLGDQLPRLANSVAASSKFTERRSNSRASAADTPSVPSASSAVLCRGDNRVIGFAHMVRSVNRNLRFFYSCTYGTNTELLTGSNTGGGCIYLPFSVGVHTIRRESISYLFQRMLLRLFLSC